MAPARPSFLQTAVEMAVPVQRSYFRTLLMYGFHFLVWFLCVKKIRDTQCGFKLLTRKAASRMFSTLHIERWAFDVELLYIAQHCKIPIEEVAVNWTEIEEVVSKYIADTLKLLIVLGSFSYDSLASNEPNLRGQEQKRLQAFQTGSLLELAADGQGPSLHTSSLFDGRMAARHKKDGLGLHALSK
uniref:Uncharacterized protein n=1 Tax=Sphaerodactylus townsendi TaxID=933632 RepID=A0ACB8ESV6_9SAUR